MADIDIVEREARPATPGWLVVAERELLDLWVGGRGPLLMLAFTCMLSVTSYLVATNQALNFLEARESVSLTLGVAVAVSALLVVLASADAITGERERGTLETLLLTPASSRAVVIGKGLAAMSLWLTAFMLSVPYVWFLGRGVAVVGRALAAGFVVSALLALFLAGLGLVVSALSRSNRVSLSVSLFLLVAMYAPTQLTTVGLQPAAGTLLQRLDPFTSGLRYLDKVIVGGHSFGSEAGLLVVPVVAALVLPTLALTMSDRFGAQSRWRP